VVLSCVTRARRTVLAAHPADDTVRFGEIAEPIRLETQGKVTITVEADAAPFEVRVGKSGLTRSQRSRPVADVQLVSAG